MLLESCGNYVFFSQINWASTESQIEECMMKGREKVSDVQMILAAHTVTECIFRWDWIMCAGLMVKKNKPHGQVDMYCILTCHPV